MPYLGVDDTQPGILHDGLSKFYVPPRKEAPLHDDEVQDSEPAPESGPTEPAADSSTPAEKD